MIGYTPAPWKVCNLLYDHLMFLWAWINFPEANYYNENNHEKSQNSSSQWAVLPLDISKIK